jgi:cell division protein FtsI/penicillin-binding protein 2/cell division protein FtsW (lipid II flippase)
VRNLALRDSGRKVEGVLTIAVLLFVLLPTLIAVYMGKRSEPPADAVMVNEATQEQFAHALLLEPDIAARLVASRARLGAFGSADILWDLPLLPSDEADRLAPQFAEGRLDHASAGQMATALGMTPPVARRLAAYRDRLLTPLNSPGVVTSTAHKLSPRWFRRAPLLDPQSRTPGLKQALIRTPQTVFRRYYLGVFVLTMAVFLVPPWMRGKLRIGGDPYLVPLALLLCGLGVAMLFSLKDPLRDYAVYEHHLIGVFIGIVAMAAAARLAPLARLRIKNYLYVWMFAAFALVAGLMIFGRGPEGVKLNLLGFQPVEIIKLLLVLFLAAYLSDRAELIAERGGRQGAGSAPRAGRQWFSMPRRQDLGPIVLMFVFAMAMFYVIKDLGPGLLLFATFVSVLYLTTGRASFLGVGCLMVLLGGVFGYWRHIGVFVTRVDMWQHPFANLHPNGLQLGQSYWGFASGGWAGSGLGLGMPGLIPRGGSDLAFASWAEETGLLGAWLVLLVFAALVWRGICIALRANNDLDRALAFGLTALFGLQTLLILGGVTGLFPLTGIALPFLSYGNSALVADFVLIGLLRGISVPPSGGVGSPVPRPEVVKAAYRFAVALGIALLGGVGIWRLSALQGWGADAIAVAAVRTPDADGVLRPHLNPRLLAVEREIERGSIYDRKGRVVATSRYREIRLTVTDDNAALRLANRRGRLYPFGPALAHLVGYLDPGVGGPFGFEKAYNNELRGFRQYAELLSDYRRRHLPGYEARRGRDLRLTLDGELQRTAQAVLWQTTSKLKDLKTGLPKDRAAFVLIAPSTGEVLVAATIPSFDPNGLTPEKFRALVHGPDAEREHWLINRATDGLYPPGSTLKVATTACALDNLTNAMQFEVVCNQVDTLHWQAGGKTYSRVVHDDKDDPKFGPMTLAPAFRVSSNIYFANLAVAVGSPALQATLRDRFLFHRVPKGARFDAGLAEIGFGQGAMWASPLEMGRLAASVANAGKMQPAHFVAGLTDPANKEKPIYPVVGPAVQTMRAGTAASLQQMMRSVTVSGTAAGVFAGLPYAVAGKTGTAQNPQFDQEPHSWFIGFAPYSDRAAPRYAFACIVENGGYGRRVAAAVCRDMLKKLP